MLVGNNATSTTRSHSSGWFPNLFATTPSAQAVSATSALTVSAFYNGVDQISNDLAKIPFQVYTKTNQGRSRDRNHPVDKLISSNPSPLMTSFTLRKMLVQSAIVKGDGFAVIIRNNAGRPVEIRYTDYYDVHKVFKYDNDIWYAVKGYKNPLPSSEMIHIQGYSDNGLRGCSVIQYAAASLGISINAQAFASKSYDNKAISTGVLETDKEIKTTNKPLVASAFATAMQEPTTYRTAVLDEGMKYKRISLTPAELQFIETHKNGVVEVARWLNIAPQKLKDMDGASYNALEFVSIQHVSDCIQPWAVKIQQECDRKLFTPAEQATTYTAFKYNALMQTDAKSRADYYSKSIMMGWQTQNEVRTLEDLNTIDGHDQLLTPVNTQSQEQIQAALQNTNSDG